MKTLHSIQPSIPLEIKLIARSFLAEYEKYELYWCAKHQRLTYKTVLSARNFERKNWLWWQLQGESSPPYNKVENRVFASCKC